MWEDSFALSKNLSYTLVDNIATRNKAKVGHSASICLLWDQRYNCGIDLPTQLDCSKRECTALRKSFFTMGQASLRKVCPIPIRPRTSIPTHHRESHSNFLICLQEALMQLLDHSIHISATSFAIAPKKEEPLKYRASPALAQKISQPHKSY